LSHTLQELQQMQALPLDLKVALTKSRIRAWINEYGTDGVYVSFSGGKDSTVLLDLVRQDYPEVPAVFCNTGLELPEVLQFVRKYENVTWLRPKMSFREIVEKYGYPFFGKEISETVYGARRYLTELRRRTENPPDRQTDRQTRPIREWHRICDQLGIERRYGSARTSQTSSEYRDAERERAVQGYRKTLQLVGAYQDEPRESLNHYYHANQIFEVTGDRFGGIKPSELHKNKGRENDAGVAKADELYEQIKYGTMPEPIRLQMLNGTFKNQDGTKSMFNKARYQFMLKAPFEISNRCCYVMKKSIAHKYQKDTGRYPMTAQMASESKLRTQQWLKNGCNGFNLNSPISNPMSFWTESDVLLYIREHKLPIASVYGDIVGDDADGQMNLELFELDRPCLRTTGMSRTGCFACMYGYQREKPEENRLEMMLKYSNPKLVDYLLRGGEFRESDGLWHPCRGLGYWFIIEYVNKYGNFKLTYPNREYYIETYRTPETDRYLKGETAGVL